MFWSEEKVNTWYKLLYDEDGEPLLDTRKKPITLRNEIHESWNQGFFALKPSLPSEDGKKMEVAIYFLDKLNSPRRENVPLTTPPPGSPSELTECYIHHYHTGQRLVSGDKILITTDDPEKLPLPSYDLLEMQWVLTRLMRMAADRIDGIRRFNNIIVQLIKQLHTRSIYRGLNQ